MGSSSLSFFMQGLISLVIPFGIQIFYLLQPPSNVFVMPLDAESHKGLEDTYLPFIREILIWIGLCLGLWANLRRSKILFTVSYLRKFQETQAMQILDQVNEPLLIVKKSDYSEGIIPKYMNAAAQHVLGYDKIIARY